MKDVLLDEDDRQYLINLLRNYREKNFDKRYIDSIWEAYQENKQALDEYDAFFAELFEDALLSDRPKILQYLRKERKYNLKLRELWRKYLIRFPELKADADEAYIVYEDKVGSHIGFNPFWQIRYSYEDGDGKITQDRLCICNDYHEYEQKDYHKFFSIHEMFLIVFLIKNWDKHDVYTKSRLKERFFYEEMVNGCYLFTPQEIESILKRLGIDPKSIKENKEV